MVAGLLRESMCVLEGGGGGLAYVPCTVLGITEALSLRRNPDFRTAIWF
jgi:hypothetical protein